MNLADATELLKGGEIFIKHGELKIYSDRVGNECVVDERMVIENGLHKVLPIGLDVRGYVYYCCPDCQQIHFIHKSKIGKGKIISPGCCRVNCCRYHIGRNRRIIKIKRDKIYLNVSSLKG